MLWGWVRWAALILWVVGILVLGDSHGASATDSAVPAPLADAVSEALTEWGEFASTGDITFIESAFADGGPQFRQLREESVAWADNGLAEPLRFTVRELCLRRRGPEVATVWARVEATRAGFESRLLSWDFDLVRRDGRWQVWTVVAAQPLDPAPPVVEGAADAPTASSSTTTTSPQESPPEPREAATSPLGESKPPTGGVRLPVLSAWIIVITIVGVASAGYLAPRIDRRGEG
jgi:hypothetical protein